MYCKLQKSSIGKVLRRTKKQRNKLHDGFYVHMGHWLFTGSETSCKKPFFICVAPIYTVPAIIPYYLYCINNWYDYIISWVGEFCLWHLIFNYLLSVIINFINIQSKFISYIHKIYKVLKCSKIKIKKHCFLQLGLKQDHSRLLLQNKIKIKFLIITKRNQWFKKEKVIFKIRSL